MSRTMLYFLSLLKRNVSAIVNDTLKKDGKWSRTSLTMFWSFAMACGFALYDLFTFGFRIEVFITFMGSALGSKLVDAQSKKLEK